MDHSLTQGSRSVLALLPQFPAPTILHTMLQPFGITSCRRCRSGLTRLLPSPEMMWPHLFAWWTPTWPPKWNSCINLLFFMGYPLHQTELIILTFFLLYNWPFNKCPSVRAFTLGLIFFFMVPSSWGYELLEGKHVLNNYISLVLSSMLYIYAVLHKYLMN